MKKRVFLSPPDVGVVERRLLLDAFDSNWIAPLGPHVDAFEHEFAEFVGMPQAVALSSGTAALHLALHILGIGPGDVVVAPTLTFAATINAIKYVGATPVLIDASRDTWTIDPDLLEEELEAQKRMGRLPAAVVTVDLYGQSADYDRILQICERQGVPMVADAAEAVGSTYRDKPVGSFGACSVFSFNGNKIMTTSGGGMFVCRERSIADRVRNVATQARQPAAHYEHVEVGFNYRMSNLLAAVGRGQLQGLPDKVKKRRQVNATYREVLANEPALSFMPEAPYGRSNCWLTCILVDPTIAGVGREDIRQYLETQNIEARPVWKPMHLQPVFRDCAVRGGSVAEDLFLRGLCLPSGSNLTPEDQSRVTDAVQSLMALRR